MTMQRPQEPPTPGGKAPDRPTFQPGERKIGRPSSLTPELEAKLLNALRSGSSVPDAARFCGLSPATVEGWVQRGRGKLEAYGRPADPQYVRFARMVDEARATVKVLVVGNLVAQTRNDWRAAAYYLRFVDPEWREGALAGTDRPGPDRGGTTVEGDVNVLIVGPDQIPDFARDIVRRQRAERDAAEATIDVTPPPQLVARTNGTSHRSASDGLAVEGDAAIRPGE